MEDEVSLAAENFFASGLGFLFVDVIDDLPKAGRDATQGNVIVFGIEPAFA